MSEYPTAEEELKTMTKRFWAQVEATEKVVKERDQYREALDRIARPIWWMQEDAKRDGCTINGAMAATLADSGNYLRSIAEKALSLDNVKGDSRPPEGDGVNETAHPNDGGTPTESGVGVDVHRLVRIFHFIVDDVPLVGWVMIVGLLAAATWAWVTLL